MFSFRPAHLARSARLGLLLAALGITPVAGLVNLAHAADEAPAAAAAPVDSVRAEFSPILKSYDELMTAKDYKGAMAKLAELDAFTAKTPYEEFTIERRRVAAASAAGDNKQTAISLEKTMAMGRLSPAEQLLFMQALIGIQYQGAEYAKALEGIDRYYKAGGKDPNIQGLHVQALYFNKDYPKAMEMLRGIIKAEIAANKAPNESFVKMLLNCGVNTKDNATYIEAVRYLVEFYPKKEYWEDLLSRYIGNTANADRFIPGYYRLKLQMGLMTSADEFTEMADLSMRAAQPGEAKKALDAGFQLGILGKAEKADAKKLNALRDRVNKAAQDDLKSLEQADSIAAKAKEGTGLVNLGYALVINGNKDKGLALIEKGLKLGVKKPDEMRLLAGIAYVLAERKDEAIKMFATVQSNDGGTELAKYWSMNTNKPMVQ